MYVIEVFNLEKQVITILNTPRNLEIFASKGYFPKTTPVKEIKLESEINLPKIDVNTLMPIKAPEVKIKNGKKKK